VQGCQTFHIALYQNDEKLYQMTTKLTNGHKIGISSGRNLLQMTIPRLYQHFPFQGPPKLNQIGTFGTKMYHLATLPMWRNTRLYFFYLAPINHFLVGIFLVSRSDRIRCWSQGDQMSL
jgi:hypothetical protein